MTSLESWVSGGDWVDIGKATEVSERETRKSETGGRKQRDRGENVGKSWAVVKGRRSETRRESGERMRVGDVKRDESRMNE